MLVSEAVKAIAVWRFEQTVSDVEVIAFYRARISAYKPPRSVDFIESLPRNASGRSSSFVSYIGVNA